MSLTILDHAHELARWLNAGRAAEEAIFMAGFDPAGENGPEIFTEHEHLGFDDSDLLDCGWENGESITVKRTTLVIQRESGQRPEYRSVWRVFATREVTP